MQQAWELPMNTAVTDYLAASRAVFAQAEKDFAANRHIGEET